MLVPHQNNGCHLQLTHSVALDPQTRSLFMTMMKTYTDCGKC